MSMITINKTLMLYDLQNCGLFDEGVANLVAFLGESKKLVVSTSKVKHSIFVLTGLASSGKDALLNAVYNTKLKYHPDLYFLTKITTRELFQDEKYSVKEISSRSVKR